MTIHLQCRASRSQPRTPCLRRPSGVVAFLFTDLVDSTRLWEDNPAAMALAFQQHERIVRATCKRFNGYVYKMVGDAFQVAFSLPAQALQAALELQRRNAAGSLGVRMALHRGCTEERANDYVGPVLNRLARLVAACSGGQILLTQEMALQLRPDLSPAVRLADLGSYRLKDLRGAEHIFEAVAAGRPLTCAPLNPAIAEPALRSLAVGGAVGAARPEYAGRF